MKNEKGIEIKHAICYWTSQAEQALLLARELESLETTFVQTWSLEQRTVLDDLRQAGSSLSQAAERLLEEIKDS